MTQQDETQEGDVVSSELTFNIELYNKTNGDPQVKTFIAGLEAGFLVKMEHTDEGAHFTIVASGQRDKPSGVEDVVDMLRSTAHLIEDAHFNGEGNYVDPREGDIEDELDRLEEEADRG